MNKTRPRFNPAFSLVNETLESRVVLSGIGSTGAMTQAVVHSSHKVATETTMTVKAGTLGQAVTFNVTVKGPASAGSPSGTVNIVDHGLVIQSLNLSPAGSTGKSSVSEATYTMTPQAGNVSYFFGKHPVSAVFVPGAGFSKSSSGPRSFTVTPPAYTTLADGVKVATIAPGTGPAIQSGQTASVLYTGYLASNGEVFDDSAKDGGSPLRFTLGAGQVVPGFDAGTSGMQVGETRVILIPASQAYGATANGPIPANSDLIFVMTLEAIS